VGVVKRLMGLAVVGWVFQAAWAPKVQSMA
jgi:hypothetical protein